MDFSIGFLLLSVLTIESIYIPYVCIRSGSKYSFSKYSSTSTITYLPALAISGLKF